MEEAFAQPGIEVSGKARGSDGASFLTRLHVFELAEHGGPTRDIEAMERGYDLFCKLLGITEYR